MLGVHGLLGEGRGAVGVTAAVGPGRQPPSQSRMLFQRAEGGPERRLELIRLDVPSRPHRCTRDPPGSGSAPARCL